MTIYIHEFSTGIQPEKTADGGWVSQGFTGQYMNKTIDTVPRAVQEAISNRNFSVAEGASSDKPAFVGREVAGYGEEWSVVAVVTRGRDDRGRSASMYRYFLSEGLGKLPAIWNWLQSEKANGRKIFFQPFDPYFAANVIAKPYQSTQEEVPYPKKLPDDLKDLLDGSIPIFVSHDSSYPPTMLNKVAEEVRTENQLIAWAYNVEALEEPRVFQVIQPASSRAEDLLKKAIASKPNSPAPISGERAIISAINGLVKRDRVKPEQVETIENALSNPQINDAYWESIFKGRGADKALKQGIYSADMVRLLTLKAMIIPETLPEFLAWISKEGKQQEGKEVSENFQVEMKKSLSQFSESDTNLISRVYQGVISIVPKLIKQPQLLDSVVWLLGSDKGLWGYFYSRQIKNEIDNDLSSMRYYGRGKQGVDFKLAEDKEWQKVFSEIEVFWRSRSRMQPQYQPLAELFSRLNNYQLSALFHYISSGVVPKEVFYKLARGYKTKVYGVTVKRHIDFYEYLWIATITIGGIKLKAIVVFGLVLSGLILGGGLRNFVLKSDAEKAVNKIANSFTEEYKKIDNSIKPKQVKVQLISNLEEYPEVGRVNSWKCDIAKEILQKDAKAVERLNCSVFKQPISKEIKFQALQEFETSKTEFNKILDEILGQYNPSSSATTEELKDKERKEQQAEIIKVIKKNLIKDTSKKANSLDICTFDNDCQLNKQFKEALAFRESWIDSIYSYQQRNGITPNGVLEENTATKLKEEVKKEVDITKP